MIPSATTYCQLLASRAAGISKKKCRLYKGWLECYPFETRGSTVHIIAGAPRSDMAHGEPPSSTTGTMAVRIDPPLHLFGFHYDHISPNFVSGHIEVTDQCCQVTNPSRKNGVFSAVSRYKVVKQLHFHGSRSRCFTAACRR